MAIVISIGKYGGFYFYRGFGFRLCLGWLAITFFHKDGDEILGLASVGAEALIDHSDKMDLLSVALDFLGCPRIADDATGPEQSIVTISVPLEKICKAEDVVNDVLEANKTLEAFDTIEKERR